MIDRLLLIGAFAALSAHAEAQYSVIDFGDDSSMWAQDGECDDPRFEGDGMTSTPLLDEDAYADRSDCEAAYRAGTLSYKVNWEPEDGASPAPDPVEGNDDFIPIEPPPALDFGDNSSDWARDDECDDPRFEGPAMAVKLMEQDIGRDADDCRARYREGEIKLRENAVMPLAPRTPSEFIDFGTNESRWANDAQCDDPRFYGHGASRKQIPEDERADYMDCLAAYENGRVRLRSE